MRRTNLVELCERQYLELLLTTALCFGLLLAFTRFEP